MGNWHFKLLFYLHYLRGFHLGVLNIIIYIFLQSTLKLTQTAKQINFVIFHEIDPTDDGNDIAF